jgi:hypothetical protein
MSSIIKVDQIQLADGSTPTVGDLGLNVTGTPIQVVHEQSYAKTYASTAGSPASAIDVSITPKKAGSSFIVNSIVNISLNKSGNADTDMAIATVYRVGGSSSTLTTAEYTTCGGQVDDGGRERAGGHVSWYSTDTWVNNWSSSYGASYNTAVLSSELLITPSYTLGQSIHFRILGQSDRADWLIFNGHATSTNGGGITSLKITEIAG